MSYQAGLPSDRAPEPPAPPLNPLLMVVSFVLSFLLWLTVVCQYVFIVPRVERLFGDFRMKLPWLTEQVLHHYRWAVPAITVAAFLVCIALGRRSSWPWLFLLILLPLIINVLVGVSLYFPNMELLDGLSGGKK